MPPDFLAPLRPDLEIIPSPVPDRPGLLVRDPFRYSDVAIIVPPLLLRGLTCFDGSHSRADLWELFTRLTGGSSAVDQMVEGLVTSLSTSGFLDDETFRQLRADRQSRFAREAVRTAAFAGGGYPGEAHVLGQTLDEWLERAESPGSGGATARVNVGIAAPHASPTAGVATYGAAYRALGHVDAETTFVVLGTSHYGAVDRIGLTRKPFRTPFGDAATDVGMVDDLVRAVPGAVDVEDYCHAVEHSIEFQVVFLQRLFGAAVRILPILCGPFSSGLRPGTIGGVAPDGPALPERVAPVRDALGALADLHRRHGERLRWVLGVDMTHIGPRYGDARPVRAGDEVMTEVAARDRARLDRIVAGDAEGFWRLTHERGTDDLKWCGAAPLYAFLRAVPGACGQVLDYHQWNIDDTSVVTFAALRFD